MTPKSRFQAPQTPDSWNLGGDPPNPRIQGSRGPPLETAVSGGSPPRNLTFGGGPPKTRFQADSKILGFVRFPAPPEISASERLCSELQSISFSERSRRKHLQAASCIPRFRELKLLTPRQESLQAGASSLSLSALHRQYGHEDMPLHHPRP